MDRGMPIKLLMIFVGENDQWHDLPLYEAIVRRLRHIGLAGATVQPGIMGYGSHHSVHRKRLFGVSDDRPMTILIADEEEKLRKVLPEIKPMMNGGLILLVDAERPL